MNPPNGYFAKKVRMSAVAPQSFNTKAHSVLGWQFFVVITVLLQQFVLSWLEVPLLLISNELSYEKAQPYSNEAIVDHVERSLWGKVDGSWEPLNENELIVCDEEKVQKFNKNPVVIFTNIDPSIILASSLESSLSAEIVSVLTPPKDNHSKHDLLTERHRNIWAHLLMIQIMNSITDR